MRHSAGHLVTGFATQLAWCDCCVDGKPSGSLPARGKVGVKCHTWQRLKFFLTLFVLVNLAVVSHLGIVGNSSHVMVWVHLTCGSVVVSLEVRVTVP